MWKTHRMESYISKVAGRKPASLLKLDSLPWVFPCKSLKENSEQIFYRVLLCKKSVVGRL